MKRKLDGSLFVSLALHVVLGAGLIYVLSIPYPLEQWLREHRQEPPPTERLRYIRLPDEETRAAPRSGGDGRHLPAHPAKPLVAPSQVPTTVEATPNSVPAEEGSGPVIGKGGATEGIVPNIADPRIWLPPGDIAVRRKTPTERLDSALAAMIAHHLDSVDRANGHQRAPGDWTVEKDGQKWGMDSQKMYFGKFWIPNAILALLPITGGNNPILEEEGRQRNAQHAEIYENAERAMNNDDFHDAVKRIRMRKEKEHEEEMARRKKEKEAQQASKQPPPPPPHPADATPAVVP